MRFVTKAKEIEWHERLAGYVNAAGDRRDYRRWPDEGAKKAVRMQLAAHLAEGVEELLCSPLGYFVRPLAADPVNVEYMFGYRESLEGFWLYWPRIADAQRVLDDRAAIERELALERGETPTMTGVAPAVPNPVHAADWMGYVKTLEGAEREYLRHLIEGMLWTKQVYERFVPPARTWTSGKLDTGNPEKGNLAAVGVDPAVPGSEKTVYYMTNWEGQATAPHYVEVADFESLLEAARNGSWEYEPGHPKDPTGMLLPDGRRLPAWQHAPGQGAWQRAFVLDGGESDQPTVEPGGSYPEVYWTRFYTFHGEGKHTTIAEGKLLVDQHLYDTLLPLQPELTAKYGDAR